MLAVVFSKINTRACLVFTAVFWTLSVFLLTGKMLKGRPVTRDLATIILLILYSAPLYMIMGLGDDIAGLLRAIGDDIAGLTTFPLFEKAVYTVQRTVKELSQAVSVIRTGGNMRQVMTLDFHYLILGISGGSLLFMRASCCIVSALAALPECISEWLRSRKEEKPEAEAAT